MKYQLDNVDLGVDYADAGLWRSYEVSGQGETSMDLYRDLTIAEIDQDGGELVCYGYDEANSEVQRAVEKQIDALIQRVYISELRNSRALVVARAAFEIEQSLYGKEDI